MKTILILLALSSLGCHARLPEFPEAPDLPRPFNPVGSVTLPCGGWIPSRAWWSLEEVRQAIHEACPGWPR